MKTILFLLFTITVITANGQTSRIRDLVSQSTYDSNLYFAVDRSTFATHRKILASTLTNYINGLSLTRDTAIWERLDTLENNSLFVVGGEVGSVQLKNASDTAHGEYSMAIGYNTEAGSDYSFTHGINTNLTDYPGARAYSGGTGYAVGVDGWAQNVELSISGATATGGSDTMLCGGTEPLDVINNHAYIATIKIIGVAKDGADKGLTYLGVFSVMVKQVAGTTSIGAVDTLAYNIEAGITATVVITADDANEELIITVNGTDGGAMFWYGEVNIQMIKFD